MRVEFVTPFIQAAKEVLEAELGVETVRGNIRLHKSAYTTDDVTALVGVTGQVSGLVLYSLAEPAARVIVSRMMGQEFGELDALAQSGIGELGNVITGRAAVLLADAGFRSNIAPPVLILGRGTMVTTLDMNRLVVPLRTAVGELQIQVVLKETAAPGARAGLAA